MMNAKCEKRMQPVRTAVMILGLLSLSPFSAQAVDRQGLTWSELQTLGDDHRDAKFEVYKDGDRLKFAGMVPKSCLEGANASYKVVDGDKHMITIDFPKCREGRSADPNEERVPLSEAFIPGLPIAFNKKVTGKFYLQHFNAGDPNSRRKPEPEAILDADGKQIENISQETLAEQERRVAEEAENAKIRQAQEFNVRREQKKFEDFVKNVNDLCTRGDWVGLSTAIESASAFMGDITSLLEKASQVQKKTLQKNMEKAKDAESMRDAYEALIASADQFGLDSDEITKNYIKRRIDLATTAVNEVGGSSETGGRSASEVAEDLKTLVSDIKETDGGLKKNRAQIAYLYSTLATNVANSGKHDESIKYYESAMAFSDADGKQKIEGTLTQMLTLDWKECIEKNKLNQAGCDAKFLAKAKDHAKAALEIAKAKGVESEDYQGMQSEYITTFGIEGPSMAVKGFGNISMNQQYAGAAEQFKRQQLMQGMQEQQMNMMVRMGMVNPMMMLNSPMGGMGMGGMGMGGMGMIR